ncbi:hypothetical protein, partial [Vibrio caribbeanicus]|uniref:hypothetical protein n=1 Tax=Vibrio caribbeanicus TaxID=701175 RepID=UPI0030DB3025
KMAAHYDFLETVKRVETGSKVAKALRRNGKIPGIFYYKGEENIKLPFYYSLHLCLSRTFTT